MARISFLHKHLEKRLTVARAILTVNLGLQEILPRPSGAIGGGEMLARRATFRVRQRLGAPSVDCRRQIVLRLQEIGLNCEGTLELLDGFIEVTLCAQRDAVVVERSCEVVADLAIRWTEIDGSAERREPFGPLSRSRQHVPQI